MPVYIASRLCIKDVNFVTCPFRRKTPAFSENLSLVALAHESRIHLQVLKHGTGSHNRNYTSTFHMLTRQLRMLCLVQSDCGLECDVVKSEAEPSPKLDRTYRCIAWILFLAVGNAGHARLNAVHTTAVPTKPPDTDRTCTLIARLKRLEHSDDLWPPPVATL